MIRFIITIVAFFMMIGGVIGGLYYWGIDPLAKLGLTLGKAPAVEQKLVVKPSGYVDFGLLVVPLIRDREVRSQAELILRLEVPMDGKEAVAAQLPRLQAAYLEDMIIFLPVSMRASNVLDITAIRQRLQLVSDRVLGPGQIRNVVVEHSDIQ